MIWMHFWLDAFQWRDDTIFFPLHSGNSGVCTRLHLTAAKWGQVSGHHKVNTNAFTDN